MDILNKIKSDDYNWRLFSKEEREVFLNAIREIIDDKDSFDKAVTIGWRPVKYLGNNKCGCKFWI